MKPKNLNYLFIGKSLFFPSSGILAIADLHLGYEKMLKTSGFDFPINQIKETKKEMEEIFNEIKKRKMKLKKIIILGDLKHFFNFDISEKYEIRKFLEFIENVVGEKNIILLKGNHEKMFIDNREHKFFHIENDVAFLHGDKLFPEILRKNISTIVMGHLHPAIYIRDPKSSKKEKYKCFLVGNVSVKELCKWNKELISDNKKLGASDSTRNNSENFFGLMFNSSRHSNKKERRIGREGWESQKSFLDKKITCIVLPSFLQTTIGTDILGEYKDKKGWSFIQKKSLLKFRAFVVGEENQVYTFGVVGKMK